MALPFTAILQALTAFFQWRAKEAELASKTAHYELSRRIDSDIANDENEIARLRLAGASSNHALADRLLKRIVRAQGVAADLPAPRVAAESGPAGADAGGALPPAGG